MPDMKQLSLLLLSVLLFSGCAGLNYSKTYPGAQNFHPQSVLVLPVTVGKYETAQELVEDILAKKMGDTGSYKQVVSPYTLKTVLAESPELSHDVSNYIVLLNTVGVSDRLRAKNIGRIYQTQALLAATITDWGYGWVDGEKMGWFGLRLTLVDVKSGDIVWQAKHKSMQDYLVRQPVLAELCEELLDQMLQEMPH